MASPIMVSGEKGRHGHRAHAGPWALVATVRDNILSQQVLSWHGTAPASRTAGPHHFSRRSQRRPPPRALRPPGKIVTPTAANAVGLAPDP